MGGKIVVVTGSTRGIGRRIVETLLADGAEVAISARKQDEVDAAVAELSAKGKVVGGVLDVSNAAG